MNDRQRSPRQLVSLSKLFPEAVVASGEEILARSCSSRIKSKQSSFGSHHVFVSRPAVSEDAAAEAQSAIDAGAGAILTDRMLPISAPQCVVPDVAAAYAVLHHELAGRPSDRLLTIGVLGTHGKTAVALYAAAIFKHVGGRCGYWTTLGASEHGERPLRKEERDCRSLNRWMKSAADDGCVAAVIEVSDTMLNDRSAAGLNFDVLVVPSLRENQRYDKTLSRKLEQATADACVQLKDHGVVVFNADDARASRWVARHDLPAIGYGLNADCEVRGVRRSTADGEQLAMISAGRSVLPLEASEGEYLLRHKIGGLAVAYACGLELHEAVAGVEKMKRIPGRLEAVQNDRGLEVVVDRADQADRLAVAMHSLNTTGRPTVVVAEVPETATAAQRAAYGRVLSKTASRVILTQSRHSILVGQKLAWEVVDGFDSPTQVEMIPNRRVAIEAAILESAAGSLVVLAGMGSETWMPPREKSLLRDIDVASSALLGRKPMAVADSLAVAESAQRPQLPIGPAISLRLHREPTARQEH